jgi:hypothetical protein
MAKVYKSRSAKEFDFGEILAVSSQGENLWIYLPNKTKLRLSRAEAKYLRTKLFVTCLNM